MENHESHYKFIRRKKKNFLKSHDNKFFFKILFISD